MTTFEWASEHIKRDMLGRQYQTARILMVTGALSRHFYQWCLDGSMRVETIRFNIPKDNQGGLTMLVFPLRCPDIEDCRGINNAYLKTRSEWAARQGCYWLAEDYQECKHGGHNTRGKL
ncbi:hypothetical protein [Methylobacterium sp. SD21]|uniref:hypothetical protein n=1 Tax=Methylobacterium litchii TaxID=3138810 RepID=UPI00313C6A19